MNSSKKLSNTGAQGLGVPVWVNTQALEDWLPVFFILNVDELEVWKHTPMPLLDNLWNNVRPESTTQNKNTVF